jgi:hypothetical protein
MEINKDTFSKVQGEIADALKSILESNGMVCNRNFCRYNSEEMKFRIVLSPKDKMETTLPVLNNDEIRIGDRVKVNRSRGTYIVTGLTPRGNFLVSREGDNKIFRVNKKVLMYKI